MLSTDGAVFLYVTRLRPQCFLRGLQGLLVVNDSVGSSISDYQSFQQVIPYTLPNLFAPSVSYSKHVFWQLITHDKCMKLPILKSIGGFGRDPVGGGTRGNWWNDSRALYFEGFEWGFHRHKFKASPQNTLFSNHRTWKWQQYFTLDDKGDFLLLTRLRPILMTCFHWSNASRSAVIHLCRNRLVTNADLLWPEQRSLNFYPR